MPLTIAQVQDLENSILGYAFPAFYFDFLTNTRVNAGGMPALEAAINGMLISANQQDTKHGLANIVYWGNENSGYRMHRTNRFMNNVTGAQLQRFQALVAHGNVPTLHEIFALGMPQFSGVSFLSKIVAFLDPDNYCVLDLLLSSLGNTQGHKSIHGITATTQIRVTRKNANIYYS